MENGESLVVTCWGTRGSVPSPGHSTAGYGGNTSCVEVNVGSRCFILDAGTGIRLLGEKLKANRVPRSATLLLTHFHWDHIQGLPFFAPAYDPRFGLRVIAPSQDRSDPEELVVGLMGPIHFPLPFEAFSADLSFQVLNEGQWEADGVSIQVMRMRHTAFTVGYRLEALGRSIVFIPDNELVGGSYPLPPEWSTQLLEFVAGADVLLHDAMFTPEEYPERNGWGHSTHDQALDLSERAGVKRLQFFHHSPLRTDQELDDIVRHYREDVDRRGVGVEVSAAEEGAALDLGGQAGFD